MFERLFINWVSIKEKRSMILAGDLFFCFYLSFAQLVEAIFVQGPFKNEQTWTQFCYCIVKYSVSPCFLET